MKIKVGYIIFILGGVQSTERGNNWKNYKSEKLFSQAEKLDMRSIFDIDIFSNLSWRKGFPKCPI